MPDPALTKLNRLDRIQRARLAKHTQAELHSLLSNWDGLYRLESLSDEEWAAAEAGEIDWSLYEEEPSGLSY
jgi:hypothetical protein